MRLDELKSRWTDLEPLLDRLLDLEEPERSRLLERIAAGSADTGRALEALLRADRDSGGMLEHAALPPPPPGSTPDPEIVPGTRVGPYVVRRELGRGGMGAVALAERDDGLFDQQVAIKWVRPDAWVPGAGARFDAERRILARLQHPNVARLLDGGVREDGLPYLVMEYVEGEPITAWCDARRLDVRGRTELLMQVCTAVEYAHGQLVVHRDLKPDNILVTARGEVKLLDFGIAKLLDAGLDRSQTRTQSRVFTPAYATPEQYLGEEPTTATDQYQLGLVLYELLTGRRAHGRSGSSPLAHQRRVIEADPERPSRRVTHAVPFDHTPDDEPMVPAAVATARGTTVEGLAHALAGDLDAILLKALEREPRHRYPSVEAFRRDLENAYADRPVAARRATPGYRARKYVRRHRVALTASALVTLSLAAGLAGVLVQARVAAHERDLARASERRANAINEFILRELLESPMPERALGRALTVAEVLANASRSAGHAFARDPSTEAEVRMTLARSYQALGQLDEARDHAQAALRLIEAHERVGSRRRFQARELLCAIALDEGRFDEGLERSGRLVADERRALGADDPLTLRGEVLWGRAFAAVDRFAAADSVLRRTLRALPADGSDWRLSVDVKRAIAAVWIEQGRAREADSLLRTALGDERRHLGADHPLIAATLRQEAQALSKDLRYAESARVLREVVAMSTRLNGPDHPATADAWMALTPALDALGGPAEVLESIDKAVGIYRQALGNEHPRTLRALRNKAVLLRSSRRYAEADRVYQEVYETCLRTLGPTHRQTLEALRGLVYLRLNEGRTAEATALARRIAASYEQIAARPDADPMALAEYALFLVEIVPAEVRDPERAVAVAQRAVAATGRQDYVSLRALGFAQGAAGQPREAIASLRGVLALPEGARSWTSEEKLVELLGRYGAPGELERELLARCERLRVVRGEDDRHIGKTLRHLSRCYHAAGRDSLAEWYARASLAQLLKTLPPDHWEVARAEAELGRLLALRGAYAEAEPLLVRGYRAMEADPEVAAAPLDSARQALVQLYRATHRSSEALAWSRRPISARAPRDP